MTDHDLLLLTDFLRRLDVDVEGRSAEPPPADVAARLERFASGQANGKERGEIASLLQTHPEWIRHLAQIIRQRAQA
jgi:anti-sigma factor RsiW